MCNIVVYASPCIVCPSTSHASRVWFLLWFHSFTIGPWPGNVNPRSNPQFVSGVSGVSKRVIHNSMTNWYPLMSSILIHSGACDSPISNHKLRGAGPRYGSPKKWTNEFSWVSWCCPTSFHRQAHLVSCSLGLCSTSMRIDPVIMPDLYEGFFQKINGKTQYAFRLIWGKQRKHVSIFLEKVSELCIFFRMSQTWKNLFRVRSQFPPPFTVRTWWGCKILVKSIKTIIPCRMENRIHRVFRMYIYTYTYICLCIYVYMIYVQCRNVFMYKCIMHICILYEYNVQVLESQSPLHPGFLKCFLEKHLDSMNTTTFLGLKHYSTAQ